MYGRGSRYSYEYGEGAKGDDAASMARALTIPAQVPKFESHRAAFDFVNGYAGTLPVYAGSGGPVYAPHIQIVHSAFSVSVWVKPYGDALDTNSNRARASVYRCYETENR